VILHLVNILYNQIDIIVVLVVGEDKERTKELSSDDLEVSRVLECV